MDKEPLKTESEEPSIEELYSQLTNLLPKIVAVFTPSNRSEQEEKFLSGEVRNPRFVYEKLDNGNFDEALTAIQQLGENISRSPDLPPKHRAIYEEFIRSYSEQTKLIRCAQEYHNAESSKDRQAAASAYENLNQEIYGVPDEKTYRSLLGEKLGQIADKKLTGAADELRGELFQMIKFDSDQGAPERFRPSNETVEWMKGVAESLYGNMLKHVPENQANFNPNEVDSIFTEIIEQEFGEAAADWSVSVEKTTVINVNLFDKTIAIPDKNMLRSREKVRSLVVHELGVHMLRAVTGGETDVFPLANGLSGYYDAEEGLVVVMEQALRGKFIERGVDHYITAGLAYFDNQDFRGAFEAKWRLSLLSSITAGDQVDDVKIMRAKKVAFTQTLRSFRGTNDLPLFKDLSYYNGSTEVWKYLESICGDDLQLGLLLTGKVNTSKEHQRAVLESRSVEF